jgi:hypothetical protein
MNKVFFCLVVLLLAPGFVSVQAQKVDLGLSITDGELRSFYFAISEHYRVPERQVIEMREKYRLRDDELPVVFFLAARARVAPSVIVDLRLGGRSWLDITFHYGLTPDIFYVPVKTKNIGPPYGNAYGYYKKYRPTKEWKKIALTDGEVIDLVDLRFVSEYHRIPSDDVIKMRGAGKSFVGIHVEVGKGKGKKKETKDSEGKGKGKEK